MQVSVLLLPSCSDANRASSLEKEDKEVKQLGSLAKEAGIDKAMGKMT